jgi:hypothetical protein
MSSDWRSQEAMNRVIESSYLAQLNNAWTSQALSISNLRWLAVAGTFCNNPVRNAGSNTGCRSSNPYSDGIVCQDSALFNLTGRDLPSDRWNGLYAHTSDSLIFGATLFAGCNASNFPSLSAPLPQSDLVQRLRSFINSQ